MGIDIKDFIGNWYVLWSDGEPPVLEQGWKLVLGTGEAGATAPELTPDSFQVVMGFAILSPDSSGSSWTPVFSSEDQQQQPPKVLLHLHRWWRRQHLDQVFGALGDLLFQHWRQFALVAANAKLAINHAEFQADLQHVAVKNFDRHVVTG